MKKLKVILLGLLTITAYATQAGQEQLAASIRLAREEATATSAQLASTLETLNALVSQKQGDLAPAFATFRSEIPKTETAARATAARVQLMSTEREKYFTDWQSTINGINNMSLRKKAQKRLDAASRSYEKVHGSLSTAGDKFRPFLSDLADVEKALSQDVTKAGVKNIKGVVRQANWDHKFVANSITSALKEMQKMEKALSKEAE